MPVVEIAEARQNRLMNLWNYEGRAVRDQTEYRIAEVYHDGDKLRWADDPSDCLRWDNFDDPKTPSIWMQQAPVRLLFRVTDEGRLVEVPPLSKGVRPCPPMDFTTGGIADRGR